MELDSFCLKLTDISLFVRADRSLLRENGKARSIYLDTGWLRQKLSPFHFTHKVTRNGVQCTLPY